MKKSKTDVEKEIKAFFENIENKTPKQVKKIKKLAMSQNIKLGSYRKKFCKKCFYPLQGKTRIKDGTKSITCEKCEHINRWKIKNKI